MSNIKNKHFTNGNISAIIRSNKGICMDKCYSPISVIDGTQLMINRQPKSTEFARNAIQSAKGLLKIDKHRDHDYFDLEI